ncbi:MAG: putative Ig domain-containing protein, partial [bacterium]
MPFNGYTITATGATGLTYSADALPAGLAVDAASGEITGAPIPAGTFNATVRATNSAGTAVTKSVGFTIEKATPLFRDQTFDAPSVAITQAMLAASLAHPTNTSVAQPNASMVSYTMPHPHTGQPMNPVGQTFNYFYPAIITATFSGDANYSAATMTATLRDVDNTPPTVPTNLRESLLGPTSFSVTWDKSTANSIVKYYEVSLDEGAQIYRTKEAKVDSQVTPTAAFFNGLEAGSVHTVKVRAVNWSDKPSDWSPGHTFSLPSDYPNATSPRWFDVNGDGIRDEIIGGDTPALTYDILEYSNVTVTHTTWTLDFIPIFGLSFSDGLNFFVTGWWVPSIEEEIENIPTVRPYFLAETEPGYDYALCRAVTDPQNNTSYYRIHNWPADEVGGIKEWNVASPGWPEEAFYAFPATLARIAKPLGSVSLAGINATLGGSRGAGGIINAVLSPSGSIVISIKDAVDKLLKAGPTIVYEVWDGINQIRVGTHTLGDLLDIGINGGGEFQVGLKLDDSPPVWFRIEVQPPIIKKVANGDVSALPWSGATEQALQQPIYAGDTNGDMVSWTLNDLLPGNYSWTATGPYFETAVTLPMTIQGPSGENVREWRIARSDSNSDQTLLSWKPGTYRIKCHVTRSGGSSVVVEYQQLIGWRTARYLVVGQVRPIADFVATSAQQAALRSDLVADVHYLTSVMVAPISSTAASAINSYVNSASLQEVAQVWFGLNSVPPKRVAPLPNVTENERFWLVQTMLNDNPDTVALGDGQLEGQPLLDLFAFQSYRMLGEYQIKYLLTADRKIQGSTLTTVGSPSSMSGPTKMRMPGLIATLNGTGALWVLAQLGIHHDGTNLLIPPMDNPKNGKQSKDIAGGKVSLYTSARIGVEASYGNYALFERDVPYIFSEIVLAASME